jgi:hypothetical protein
MSAKFTDIPADVWEKTFYADELKEDRKADKKSRVAVSNHAAAFNWLIEVGGLSADIHQPLHIFLDKTRGCAPDEEIKFFSEKDAGALLSGEEGITDGSKRRRWKRAWSAIESEQARTGKLFAGTRKNGSIRLASRQAEEKKIAPVYFSQIVQAVVDVERLALRMRGKREDRFRRAALEVWANLPAYVAPEEEEQKIKAEPKPRAKRLAGNNTRRMTRFDGAVKESAAAEKVNGDGAALTLAARMAVQLGQRFAEELGIDRESVFRFMAEALHQAAENADLEEAEFVAPTPTGLCENAEENREVDTSYVDSPVHVEPEMDSANCVACGEVIHPERLEFDTELCDLCGPPRIKGKPTAFRILDEMERRKQKQGEIIYAEDFTV